MASIIKDKISGMRKGSADNSDVSETEVANQYMLRVTAGPSYDASTHKSVFVNTDTPCEVENDLIKAKIKVRIRNYHGLPKGSHSHSPYFDDPAHAKDQYSIAFSFVPKKDLPSKDLVWGNDFEHPIRDRLPPGFNTAFKIVKEFIDPGLECDAYADEPWLYGPALSCWFAFRIGDRMQNDEFPAPDEERAMTDGADGSGASIRQQLKLPDSGDKRRKHFLDASHREEMTFEKGRLYQADFFNPYIDFSKFALKLPGFSLGVIKYINDKTHHLRYVFKDRSTGKLLFCVVFTLLFGDQLQQALRESESGDQAQNTDRNGSVDHEQATGGAGNTESNRKHSPFEGTSAESTNSANVREDHQQEPLRHEVLRNGEQDQEEVHHVQANAKFEPTITDGCQEQSRQQKLLPGGGNHQQETPASQASASSHHGTEERVSEIEQILRDTSTVDRTGSQREPQVQSNTGLHHTSDDQVSEIERLLRETSTIDGTAQKGGFLS